MSDATKPIVESRPYSGGTVTWVRTHHKASFPTAQEVKWPPLQVDIEKEVERRWHASFAASQGFLTAWGDRVLADFLAGNTEFLDPDDL